MDAWLRRKLREDHREFAALMERPDDEVDLAEAALLVARDAYPGLVVEDYRARLDTLFAAQRLGELVPVVQGLPPLPTYADPAIVASSGGQPGELAQPRDASKLALVTGGAVLGAVILIVILLAILL